MRELSPSTRTLIDQLRGLPKRTFGFARRRTAAATGLLWKIAEASEPAALPEILSFVLERDEPIRRAAAQAASVLLAAVPTSQLPSLDERLRERSTWWGGWWGMGPRDLSRFDRLGEGASALLRIATMHPSGFVREEAVRLLARRSGLADALPFFLIRRNDWVEQVRSAAIEALDRSTAAGNAEAIVETLPLVYRLETCTRADHGSFVAEVKSLLVRPECEGALRRGIASADPKVRRSCFSLAFESSAMSLAELIRAGLCDRDPIVRLGAARAAVSAQPDDLLELLDRMDSDTFTAVRQVGFDARIVLFPQEASSTYERHLLDPSVSIRAQAQRALQGTPTRAPDVYRSEIESGETGRLDIAVLGLSEVGEVYDADLASGFLSHPLPRVRAAAVRAVARLSADVPLPVLHTALGDESPRVSRAARAIFLTDRASPDAQALRDLLDRSDHRHARLNSVSVAQALPRWERLRFLLAACVNSDSELAERASLAVQRWLASSNRAVLNPTPDDLRRISVLLEESKGWLPESTGSELAFLLRTIRERAV